MKRTALFSGALLAAVVMVPGTVSAHRYDNQKSDRGSWKYSQTAYKHANVESNDWAKDCGEQSTGTIVDALVNDGRFTTLVAAVKAAGLADTLSAPGDLTVFAPTDKAFAKLPQGTVEALLADPAALANVLKNHVVAGRVDGATAVELGEAKALTGNTLNIGYGNNGKLYINDSRITKTDVHTSNGIVHVIDAVLVP